MISNSLVKNSIGIYISPNEICIAQISLDKGRKLNTEHLLKIPTGFKTKDNLPRPMSINSEFFNEKAFWVTPFIEAVKKVHWNSSSAVISLSPQFAVLRYFVMPGVDRQFWSRSIPIESKKYIPVSFDEVVYDYNVYPLEREKKLGVLFGLTQRKSLEFITNVLKSAGFGLTAVEICPSSVERLFCYLDPEEHGVKAYTHFSNNTSIMLFSSQGAPVLYREMDFSANSSMSERRRLDIKGAVQFVARYIGGLEYKLLMLSGDSVEAWKPTLDQESSMPAQIWNPAQMSSLNNNDSAALFASGAALRGRVNEKQMLDISGLSTEAGVEKKAQIYVIAAASILGIFLLLYSLIIQMQTISAHSQISKLQTTSAVGKELEGRDADSIKKKIESLRANVKMLSALVSETDYLAPKLQVIAECVPQALWVREITFLNPFSASEMQTISKELKISGETSAKDAIKAQLIENFKKNLRATREFKVFSPPLGGIQFNLEGETAQQANAFSIGESGARTVKSKTSAFSILCTARRAL